LPTTVTSNICAPARFTGGWLTLNADGTFEMDVSYTRRTADGWKSGGAL